MRIQERGERWPDDRATLARAIGRAGGTPGRGRSSYRSQKIRQGSSFPSIFEPRRRSERALLAGIHQAHVCGVDQGRRQLVGSLNRTRDSSKGMLTAAQDINARSLTRSVAAMPLIGRAWIER
jgi:hypothetical protein